MSVLALSELNRDLETIAKDLESTDGPTIEDQILASGCYTERAVHSRAALLRERMGSRAPWWAQWME